MIENIITYLTFSLIMFIVTMIAIVILIIVLYIKSDNIKDDSYQHIRNEHHGLKKKN